MNRSRWHNAWQHAGPPAGKEAGSPTNGRFARVQPHAPDAATARRPHSSPGNRRHEKARQPSVRRRARNAGRHRAAIAACRHARRRTRADPAPAAGAGQARGRGHLRRRQRPRAGAWRLCRRGNAERGRVRRSLHVAVRRRGARRDSRDGGPARRVAHREELHGRPPQFRSRGRARARGGHSGRDRRRRGRRVAARAHRARAPPRHRRHRARAQARRRGRRARPHAGAGGRRREHGGGAARHDGRRARRLHDAGRRAIRLSPGRSRNRARAGHTRRKGRAAHGADAGRRAGRNARRGDRRRSVDRARRSGRAARERARRDARHGARHRAARGVRQPEPARRRGGACMGGHLPVRARHAGLLDFAAQAERRPARAARRADAGARVARRRRGEPGHSRGVRRSRPGRRLAAMGDGEHGERDGRRRAATRAACGRRCADRPRAGVDRTRCRRGRRRSGREHAARGERDARAARRRVSGAGRPARRARRRAAPGDRGQLRAVLRDGAGACGPSARRGAGSRRARLGERVSQRRRRDRRTGRREARRSHDARRIGARRRCVRARTVGGRQRACRMGGGRARGRRRRGAHRGHDAARGARELSGRARGGRARRRCGRRRVLAARVAAARGVAAHRALRWRASRPASPFGAGRRSVGRRRGARGRGVRAVGGPANGPSRACKGRARQRRPRRWRWRWRRTMSRDGGPMPIDAAMRAPRHAHRWSTPSGRGCRPPQQSRPWRDPPLTGRGPEKTPTLVRHAENAARVLAGQRIGGVREIAVALPPGELLQQEPIPQPRAVEARIQIAALAGIPVAGALRADHAIVLRQHDVRRERHQRAQQPRRSRHVQREAEPAPVARFRHARVEDRQIDARHVASVRDRDGAAHMHVDHDVNVLILRAHAAEPAHDRRDRFVRALPDHRHRLGGEPHVDAILFGLLVAEQVRVQIVRVRQVEQVLDEQRRAAVEPDVALHALGQPPFARQERHVGHERVARALRVAVPDPCVAESLDHRIAFGRLERRVRRGGHGGGGGQVRMPARCMDAPACAPQIARLRVDLPARRALADFEGMREGKPGVAQAKPVGHPVAFVAAARRADVVFVNGRHHLLPSHGNRSDSTGITRACCARGHAREHDASSFASACPSTCSSIANGERRSRAHRRNSAGPAPPVSAATPPRHSRFVAPRAAGAIATDAHSIGAPSRVSISTEAGAPSCGGVSRSVHG
ncbi:hypothetical protein BURPS1710b_2246 [Burkholderia pseudomallei 1710b]|uniref:Uncharacterized protein n=1 Tax=Burkholderia pseudomallei (strain 1710b) TaxID=320372 RepID=Q3JS13_BURP1|nr:hypothetical protein BURPS1710b_2246 [Burkholderia pseudomallei 1710b]